MTVCVAGVTGTLSARLLVCPYYCYPELIVIEPSKGRRRLAVLRVFQYRDFRILGLSSLFSSFSMLGENVAVGWIVLEVTDSPFMVGVAMGLRRAPQFVLGIFAGAVVDMVDRRLFMPFINAVVALPNLAIALLLVAGWLEIWHVLVLVLLSGIMIPFAHTARQSFTYDIVGPSLAMHGLAAVVLVSRAGGLVGGVLTGVIIGRVGLEPAFFAIGVGQVLSGLVMLLVGSAGQAAPLVRESVPANLKGFLIEVRHNRVLLQLVLFTGAVEMLGFSHMTILPSLARDVLNVGAEGLGIMNGIQSAGGILGVIVLASMGDVRRKGLLFLVVVHVFGVALVLLGMSNTLVLAMVLLTVVSAMTALTDVLSQTLMQLNVPNELRGRAMGSWVLAIGTSPIGHMQIGALASLVSVGFALSFSGLALVALAAGLTLLSGRLRRL